MDKVDIYYILLKESYANAALVIQICQITEN